MKETGNFIGEKSKDIKLSEMGSHVKETFIIGASTVATEAKELKEHIIKQEFAKKIFSFFGGKKEEEKENGNEQPPARASAYLAPEEQAALAITAPFMTGGPPA